MKKFTKVALILSAVFAVVGVVSLVGAMAMGFSWEGLVQMAQDGEFSVHKSDSGNSISFFESEHHEHHKSSDCRELDIDLSAGKLNLFYDDVEEIEVKQEGIPNFSSNIDGGTLQIDGGSGISFGGTDGVVTVIIPHGTKFEEVDVNIGAGQADIDGLCAAEVSVDVGAGQVKLSGLDATHFDAETDAGQIEAHLVEGEEVYSYLAECGVGEIKIGNNTIGGFSGEKTIENPDAYRFIDVECGVGQIIIDFEK